MYDPDPFAAIKMVKDRQEKAAKRKEESSETGTNHAQVSSSAPSEYTNAPEVKMANSLRDLVEDVIKKVCCMPL
jgi:hypothetical protein